MPSGDVVLGRTVEEHCEIVANVAQLLIERYPAPLRSVLFPKNAAFAAACHDIGKVSPSFFEKLRRACTEPPQSVLGLSINPSLESTWGGHAGVSQAAAQMMGAPLWVPEILGQHHGYTPPVAGKRGDAPVFGGSEWQAQRLALVDQLRQKLGMDWPRPDSEQQARLLAGLTSVADWIGSGQHFEDPQQAWQPRIAQALDEAGFIPPQVCPDLSFEQIFGFAPRPAQHQLIEAATGPGVYVLEAPMGLGKTEGALYVAYRMLEQKQASGIYFALPTQLTSNKIHQRFETFLKKILTQNSQHHALLLHANAWLQDTELGEEGRPGGAWFHQSKRGLLAPFAVGTIDQALMAAMNVKHGFVRAFGLAGKVVILDEVHSYDAYTGTLLDALIDLLRHLHCTIIILSATLNRQRRSQLLRTNLQGDFYPLITAVKDNQQPQELPVEVTAALQVTIQLQRNDSIAVQEALDRAAAGQQVLWIENTVKDAQQRYLDLASRAAELGLDFGLLHSRFNMADRTRIETHWVDQFGKPGWSQRLQRGRILVGTQVLEQSLDIDADFLVSRFAPTDMLLQRLGRLWRHTDTPRPNGSVCEAWLLAPDLEIAIQAPYTHFGASAHVYSPYVLCRSLSSWQKKAQLNLPQDIRGLIEETYAAQEEEGAMARWLNELEHGTPRRKGRQALQQLARVGLATGGKTFPESQAQTRYSEMDTFDVLLLRNLQQIDGDKASRLTLLSGEQVILPWQRHRLSKHEWKKLTVRLMQQVVPVMPSQAPQAVNRDTLEKYGLHHCFYLGDRNWADDESLLRVALVDDTDQLRGVHGGPVHDKHTLEYREDLGYRVLENQREGS